MVGARAADDAEETGACAVALSQSNNATNSAAEEISKNHEIVILIFIIYY